MKKFEWRMIRGLDFVIRHSSFVIRTSSKTATKAAFLSS